MGLYNPWVVEDDDDDEEARDMQSNLGGADARLSGEGKGVKGLG